MSRSREMQRIEAPEGRPIEVSLRDLRIDQALTVEKVGEELGITLADDLANELATRYALVWAGRRTRALPAISGLQISVASVRETYHALAGLGEQLPSDPDTSPVAQLA